MVFPKAFSGKHITHKNVTMLKGENIVVEPKDTLVIQCDGELLSENQLILSVGVSVEKEALFIL